MLPPEKAEATVTVTAATLIGIGASQKPYNIPGSPGKLRQQQTRCSAGSTATHSFPVAVELLAGNMTQRIM